MAIEASEVKRLLGAAKSLARKYRILTGKPLGITGEVAEFSAAEKISDFDLASARQSGYDAIWRRNGKRIKVQIKGRCVLPDSKPGQRVGGIKLTRDWDIVLLVLLDENFEVLEIYEAARSAITEALMSPGSKARNERGALGVRKFKSIGSLVWSRENNLSARDQAPSIVVHDEFYEIIEDIKNNRAVALHNSSFRALKAQVTYFHYIKTVSLLGAIKVLCQEDKVNEASIILRSLLNLFINLKWLTSKDADARMQRYADFEIMGKKMIADSCGIMPTNDFEREKSREIQLGFERIVKKYSLNAEKWEDLTRWPGKSIYKMAEEVGLIDDYKKVFSYLSFEEHTHPSSAGKHRIDSNGQSSAYISNPNDFMRVLVLWTSLGYYFEIEKITGEILGVTFKDNGENLTALANKYLNAAM